MHFPHHDRAAVACALAAIRRLKPDLVVQSGDALDCGVFSAHAAKSLDDKGGNFLEEEVAPYNAFVDAVQGRSGRPYIQLGGNHENRVERWLTSQAGQAASSIAPLLSVESLLRHRVDARGRARKPRENFTYVPSVGRGVYSHYAIAPNLIAIHGWSTASHASKVHMDKARTVSVVHGHTHRAQSYTTRNPLTDDLYHAWSPGCLAEMVPLYMATSPGNWAHGITVIYQSRSNPLDWTHSVIPLERGRAILTAGREVSA